MGDMENQAEFYYEKLKVMLQKVISSLILSYLLVPQVGQYQTGG